MLLPLGGATAWALDRFVVEHVEIADVSAYEASQGLDVSGASGQGATADDGAGASTGTSAGTSAGTGTVDGDTYTSDSTIITVSRVTTGSGDDTLTYYVADVVLSDMTDLRSAFAQDAFGTNITETTSDIAADNGAVLAVNGDYYGFRDTGIVIRNGVVYRDEGAREGLAIYRDGHVEVYDETTTDAQSLVDAGVWNTLSFGPALVEDGEVVAGIDDVEVDTNVGNHSIQGEQPRTAIGVVDENHLVLVVVDGRQEGYSRGATTTELARILQDLGATTAYNIDGGGSSTLWFDGEVVNSPSQGRERGTSDVLYVADGA
ncbi:Exopolysaccharide biosynthesis protein related to N-acetylglucosamine-1-phosphodiester alpha-N-acetylglucosaminidase [Mycobacteroides abscessus]|nr:Exopolysaccharide biosynthesis protein related to N-acetylglucosamine-1-phosphodiester alpha-N-acetylglucosaminidase [Mycobacteroides abscessus]